MRIERATTVPQLLSAPELFDSPPRPEWAADFLATPGHHLFFSYEDEAEGAGAAEAPDAAAHSHPTGFVSGVETLHPDKGREMFLYELGVAEPYRRRGTARALIEALAALARDRGCYGMWVGVDRDNAPALAAYRSAGASEDGPCTVMTWDFA
jgi:ribosomal protein S18 acetylase RimI-like enzyme